MISSWISRKVTTRSSAASVLSYPAAETAHLHRPRDPAQGPILVLDEATSQVDAESENLIQKAIDSLMHERTTFVIAHRFSTILSADEIVVLDRGKIVGQGRHEELLRTCETYQQLYERQLIAAPVG